MKAESAIKMHILSSDKNYFFLYSGGFDSSYGLLKLLIDGEMTSPLNIVFFDYGQAAATYEWEAVQKVYAFLKKSFDSSRTLQKPIRFDLRSDLFSWTDSVSFTGSNHTPKNANFSETEIENRNMVLFSVLYSYILSLINRQNIDRCEIVIFTGLRDKELPDASSSFFFHLSEAMEEYHKEYQISVEYIIDKTPAEILYELKNNVLGLNGAQVLEFCKSVSSCYRPQNGEPCYNCPKCKDVDSIIKFVFNKGRF